MIKKRIKFQYYRAVIDTANGSHIFDLSLWLMHMREISIADRKQTIKGIKIRLENEGVVGENNLFGISFLHLRNTNLPYLASDNEAAVDFPLKEDQYVGESTHILYDHNNHYIMLQMNKYGVALQYIEQYINFFNTGEGQIRLIPVPSANVNDRSGQFVRKISVKFVNIPNNVALRETRYLNGIFQSFQRANCLTSTIELGIGKKRIKVEPLEAQSVNDLIYDIDNNRDIITSADMVYCEDEESPSQVVDLLNIIAFDFITFELEERTSLGFGYALNMMYETYNIRFNNLALLV